jgi:hypothetical protein
LKISYLYDVFTELCREQAIVILNYENVYIHTIGKGEARHRKCKRLILGGGQAYDLSVIQSLDSGYDLEQNKNSKTICCTKPGLPI